MLSPQEFKDCIDSDQATYKNNLDFNAKFSDKEKFLKYTFQALDMDMDNFLNFYDYIQLRRFNRAYSIGIAKEGKIYYKNFVVLLHIVSINV